MAHQDSSIILSDSEEEIVPDSPPADDIQQGYEPDSSNSNVEDDHIHVDHVVSDDDDAMPTGEAQDEEEEDAPP